MAEKKTKAFISLGKISKTNRQGKTTSTDEYIVMPVQKAAYVGATYSTDAPKPQTVTITKGKLAGKTYTKEYSTRIAGTRYQLGYADGFNGVTPNLTIKIKWISFYVPRGVTLKLFLSLITVKTTRQPIKLRMPSGITTNLTVKG